MKIENMADGRFRSDVRQMFWDCVTGLSCPRASFGRGSGVLRAGGLEHRSVSQRSHVPATSGSVTHALERKPLTP
jgi:hypothetical protein